MLHVGILFELGNGVKEDVHEALRWYKAAASKGFADAQVKMGFMYCNARGVKLDYSEGMRW